MEELLKRLEKNPELGPEIEEMWVRGASAQEVASMLSANGVEAESTQVEELLATMQAKRAEAVADGEKVDKDQLKNVAGGGCWFWQTSQGMDDSCSNHFKNPSYRGRHACIEDHMQVCLFDDLCDSNWNWY